MSHFSLKSPRPPNEERVAQRKTGPAAWPDPFVFSLIAMPLPLHAFGWCVFART
jgi:hypothetical protein